MSGFGLLFAGPIQGHYWFRYLDKVGWSCNQGLDLERHHHAVHEYTAHCASSCHLHPIPLPSMEDDHAAHATRSCTSFAACENFVMTILS